MYCIIFNPTAGAGRSVKVLKDVVRHFEKKKQPYFIKQTEYKNHAVLLASEAIGQGYKGIVSIGGDGTLQEVAQALSGTKEVLGIVPAGTGNDFREAVGVPKDPLAALDVIFAGHHKRVDVGILNGEKCFLNVAGTGFDVQVIKNTNRVRRFLTGGAAYYLGIVLSLFGYKNITLEITMNNKTIIRTVLLIAIANGTCYAGGLNIAPEFCIQDGLLNIVVINRIKRWRILLELPKLARGELEKIPGLEQFICEKITIDSDKKQTFNLDGETYGETPTTFSVHKNALNVFCPK